MAGAEGVTPPLLASSLQGFGLPAHAASLRALQPGGWLARRYDMGAPWPLLAQAMGPSEISPDHGQASNVFVRGDKGSSLPLSGDGSQLGSAQITNQIHKSQSKHRAWCFFPQDLEARRGATIGGDGLTG